MIGTIARALRRWWTRRPSTRSAPAGSAEEAADTPSADEVLIIDVTAPVAAGQFRARLVDLGHRVAVPSRRHLLAAHRGQLVVLFFPATFAVDPLLLDVLDDLERALSGGRSLQVVVVWCVRERDRRVLSVPGLGDVAPTAGGRPGAWNASTLFTANSWVRALRAHDMQSTAATLHRDAMIRRLFSAESHREIGGADVQEVIALLQLLDPAHLHTVLVEVGVPGRWSDLASVVGAVQTRLARGHGEAVSVLSGSPGAAAGPAPTGARFPGPSESD